MSEFKILPVGSGQYISQWNGNSLNDGSATNPKAHPADVSASATNINIIGPGYYTGGWTGAKFLRADGTVVIDMLGATFNPGNTAQRVFDGCIVKNFTPSGSYWTAIDSVLEWLGNFLPFINTAVCVRVVIKSGDPCGGINYGMVNSLIFRTITSIPFSWQFNYVDNSVTIALSVNTGWQNNMINGLINISGTLYESKRLVDGSTRPDANPAYPDVITVFPNFYSQGNYSGNPKFIDVDNRIVESDSDLLKKQNANGFVGGVRSGKRIPVNSADSNVSITFTDINTTDPSNVIIQSPATEGQIDIIWKVSDNIAEIQRIFLDALLTFDGSQAGGSAGNNNVPDIFPTSYTPLSQAGLKPNRLLYRLRTSQSIAMPTTDAQWDNDNVALGTTPGDFYLQEWNTKPVIVTVLGVRYGNGNPESIGGTPNGINARWAHARIRLTNNRAF